MYSEVNKSSCKLMEIGLCAIRLRLRCPYDCIHYCEEVLAQIRSLLVLNYSAIEQFEAAEVS